MKIIELITYCTSRQAKNVLQVFCYCLLTWTNGAYRPFFEM